MTLERVVSLDSHSNVMEHFRETFRILSSRSLLNSGSPYGIGLGISVVNYTFEIA